MATSSGVVAGTSVGGDRRGLGREEGVVKVEFPNEVFGGSKVWEVTMIIGECEVNLDDQEAVDVNLGNSIVGEGSPKVGIDGGGNGIRAADDDIRELGVHGDERVGVDDETDQLEPRFEVQGPH